MNNRHSPAGKHTTPGFTIVELLIVVVIIAILAAITLVAYNGLQQRARASAAQAALEQAVKKLELYQIDNSAYPATLATAGITDGAITYQYTNSAPTSYCVTATSGNVSYYASDTAKIPTQGGCPGHGQGGVVAVTNLAPNPSVELSGNGWLNRWYGGSGGDGTLTLTSLASNSGTVGYRKTWTAAGGGMDIGMSYTTSNLQAGKTYTFSGYLRDSVSTSCKPLLEWKDASNVSIGSVIIGSEVVTTGNTWQRLSITQTAPANAVAAIFSFGPYPTSGVPTSAIGQTIDFDSAMAIEGSSLPAYADGNSPNWVWNGTPNASTSTGPAL